MRFNMVVELLAGNFEGASSPLASLVGFLEVLSNIPL
ncbi:MAG: hypothetical protein JWO19_5203 [Bryobacterales bacterium]|nr:hypothetical protein [Bryobacterales bacterium]